MILGLFLANMLSSSMNFSPLENTIPISPNNEIILFNNTDPIIDGDLDSYSDEWENATILIVNYGVPTTAITVRVQANETYLFMGFSFTIPEYSPINTTIPSGDSYNNQSHTWFTIVFDNNFDQKIGNELSPGDAIAVNYRAEGAYDCFINGTSPESFILDVNATGFNDAIGFLTQKEDDFHNYEISIEVAKKLNSGDENGYDMRAHESDKVKFLLLIFENETAVYNYTTLSNHITAWRTITLDTLHTYFSYAETFEEIDAIVYVTDSSYTNYFNFTSIAHFLYQYGMNATIVLESAYEFTSPSLDLVDLVILIGSLTGLTEDEIEALRFYAASGGSLMILADGTDSESKINDLLSHFDMEIYNSTIFSKNIAINSSITISGDDIIDLPFIDSSTPLTNQSINEVVYFGSAINFTDEVGEKIIQFQEGDLYSTINVTGDYYIDLDKNGEFNSSVDLSLNDSATLQAAVELQRGGRIIVTASAELFNQTAFAQKDNKYFLLREIQWLLNFQNRINIESYNVLESEVVEGEDIHVTVTIKGDNDTVLDNVHVWVTLLTFKTDINSSDLSIMEDGISYNGSINTAIAPVSFVDVSIRMHKRGYGYNETALYQVFIDPLPRGSIRIDIVALIIFVCSIGLAGIGAFAVKRYKFESNGE
jgi:hypothetical protein